MKILCDYQGWVKLPRVIFKTRVWNDSAAFRIYAALLASATHMDVLETVNGIPVRLRPGQLTATQSEICGITGYSRKIVRNGLGVLAAERIVSSHCAPDRRFSIVTVHSPPYSMKGLEVSAGQPGPIDFAKSGQSFPGDNIHNEGEFTFAAELSGAECQLENGPTSYRNKEYKESKNEKNILFPSSSVMSILSLAYRQRESRRAVL